MMTDKTKYLGKIIANLVYKNLAGQFSDVMFEASEEDRNQIFKDFWEQIGHYKSFSEMLKMGVEIADLIHSACHKEKLKTLCNLCEQERDMVTKRFWKQIDFYRQAEFQ